MRTCHSACQGLCTYQYSFRIEDAFGDSMFTEHVQFQIDENGAIYF